MMKSKGNGKLRAVLTTLCVVLGLTLAVLLGGSVYAGRLLGQIQYADPMDVPTLSQEELDQLLAQEEPDLPPAPDQLQTEVQWQEHDAQIGGEDHVVNILLIGQDRREGEKRARSDAIILCTFHTKTKTLTMTSFLRDLWVQIPGYRDNKLNAAYAAGGMKLLNETLEQNFGIQVDGNVEVDFSQFARIVDLLGGVELELRADEAAYINRKLGYGSLTQGKQRLTGEQALWYSRIRALDQDADFSRTNRQRKVIEALLEEYRGANLGTMMNIMEEVLPMVTTDLSRRELLNYAGELLPMLSGVRIVSQRIPADGTYTTPTIRGMSVVLADMEAARKLLRDTVAQEK